MLVEFHSFADAEKQKLIKSISTLGKHYAFDAIEVGFVDRLIINAHESKKDDSRKKLICVSTTTADEDLLTVVKFAVSLADASDCKTLINQKDKYEMVSAQKAEELCKHESRKTSYAMRIVEEFKERRQENKQTMNYLHQMGIHIK